MARESSVDRTIRKLLENKNEQTLKQAIKLIDTFVTSSYPLSSQKSELYKKWREELVSNYEQIIEDSLDRESKYLLDEENEQALDQADQQTLKRIIDWFATSTQPRYLSPAKLTFYRKQRQRCKLRYNQIIKYTDELTSASRLGRRVRKLDLLLQMRLDARIDSYEGRPILEQFHMELELFIQDRINQLRQEQKNAQIKIDEAIFWVAPERLSQAIFALEQALNKLVAIPDDNMEYCTLIQEILTQHISISDVYMQTQREIMRLDSIKSLLEELQPRYREAEQLFQSQKNPQAVLDELLPWFPVFERYNIPPSGVAKQLAYRAEQAIVRLGQDLFKKADLDLREKKFEEARSHLRELIYLEASNPIIKDLQTQAQPLLTMALKGVEEHASTTPSLTQILRTIDDLDADDRTRMARQIAQHPLFADDPRTLLRVAGLEAHADAISLAHSPYQAAVTLLAYLIRYGHFGLLLRYLQHDDILPADQRAFYIEFTQRYQLPPLRS